MPRAIGRDLAEVFGHAPDDLNATARSYWQRQECPFVPGKCIKFNHDQSICYGTCSVTYGMRSRNTFEEVIICPLRLYADDYRCIREISEDAFPGSHFFLSNGYAEAESKKELPEKYVVALGQRSGGEIQCGTALTKLSMDWILAHISNGKLSGFVGVELQSIDITGNYRKNWRAYFDLPTEKRAKIPNSGHGLNWANVHKRLIPQIIRKGKLLNQSAKCKGTYFVVPDSVYKRFEGIIGQTEPVDVFGPGILSVFTYGLGEVKPFGQIRDLVRCRIKRVELDEFASNFIAGGKISGKEIEEKIESALRQCTT